MPRKKQWLALMACWTFFSLPTVSHCKEPQQNSPKDNITFQSKVDVVLVPVLVKDGHGAAVGDLSKGDFEVFDNNKRQEISVFMVATKPNVQLTKDSAGTLPSGPRISPRRFVILLFDDLHMSFSDLAQTREAAKRVVSSLSEGEMAAVVSLSGVVNSGLTLDHRTLQNAMMKIQPQSLHRGTGTDCPDIDYYQAELITNEHSLGALQAATEEELNCNPSITMPVAESLAESAARQVFEMGEHDARVSLTSLRELVNRTAALPGLSTLILVSSGFLTFAAQDKHEESQIIDIAAESNITINAIDARGLYTTEVDASNRGAGSTHMNQLKSEYRRASMPLSEDVMGELAIGTGGTYVHNTNDLQAGLKALVSPPEYLYLLEFHARDLKRDNSYHRLTVKVDRHGVRVQARRGYFAPAKLPKAKTH